jgi:acetyl-CoA C-acetyltransferase
VKGVSRFASGRDDPLLVAGVRTPVGKINGQLAGIRAVDLGAAAIEGALERTPGILPEFALLGCVLQAGLGQNPARQAIVGAGAGTTIPTITLNDVCLASMSAVTFAADLVKNGRYQAIVVGGFDSMTQAPHLVPARRGIGTGDAVLVDVVMRDGLWCAYDQTTMGAQADATNARLGLTRSDQDLFAYQSHLRASGARDSGYFAGEIVSLETPDGVVSADEGIRPTTTVAQLERLPPAFSEDGTVTAGNASQLSDAGAAGVIASRMAVRRAGVQALARVIDHVTVAGPDPSLHLKPAKAAAELLSRHGLRASDIDVWEINEAFAGVVLASAHELGLDLAQVNVNGGAIALGHPLAASGFRITLTLAREMERSHAEFGIAAICGGGGQGQAVLLQSANAA